MVILVLNHGNCGYIYVTSMCISWIQVFKPTNIGCRRLQVGRFWWFNHKKDGIQSQHIISRLTVDHQKQGDWLCTFIPTDNFSMVHFISITIYRLPSQTCIVMQSLQMFGVQNGSAANESGTSLSLALDALEPVTLTTTL